MRPFHLLYCFFILLLLISCRSNDFEKSPVDELVRDMTETPVYSVILYDMDEEGSFFKDYKHQYRIIKESKEGATPEEEITDWMPVSEDFFNRNIDNMGMEIAAKSADGTVSKTAAPPGYSNYVGNEKYGQWQQGSNGQSFWAFLRTVRPTEQPVQHGHLSGASFVLRRLPGCSAGGPALLRTHHRQRPPHLWHQQPVHHHYQAQYHLAQ